MDKDRDIAEEILDVVSDMKKRTINVLEEAFAFDQAGKQALECTKVFTIFMSRTGSAIFKDRILVRIWFVFLMVIFLQLYSFFLLTHTNTTHFILTLFFIQG